MSRNPENFDPPPPDTHPFPHATGIWKAILPTGIHTDTELAPERSINGAHTLPAKANLKHSHMPHHDAPR